MITALIPSRGNPQLLAASVATLRNTAAAPPEIAVVADDDDIATIEMASEVSDVMAVVPRAGYDRLHEYYQTLSVIATGDWLLVWNDDCRMLTDHWDEVIEALPAHVYVADVQSPHSPMCCFPAVRRTAVDALGRFSTANPHVDTFWGDVGTAAGVLVKVPVHVDCVPTVRGNTHGFYGFEHQAEMATCAELLRNSIVG